jgi:exodeoxyribonuclease V gamma subunit
MNQVQEQSTYLLSNDEELLFLPTDCQPDYLAQFIAIYLQGQQQPEAFFVEAALAYVKQTHKLESSKQATKSALDAAKEQLLNALEQPFEPELRRLYASADLDLVLGGLFEQQCRELLQPVWNAVQQRA